LSIVLDGNDLDDLNWLPGSTPGFGLVWSDWYAQSNDSDVAFSTSAPYATLAVGSWNAASLGASTQFEEQPSFTCSGSAVTGVLDIYEASKRADEVQEINHVRRDGRVATTSIPLCSCTNGDSINLFCAPNDGIAERTTHGPCPARAAEGGPSARHTLGRRTIGSWVRTLPSRSRWARKTRCRIRVASTRGFHTPWVIRL